MASWIWGTNRTRKKLYQESKESIEPYVSDSLAKSLIEVQGIYWSVVVIETAISYWPQLQSLVPHSIAYVVEDIPIVSFTVCFTPYGEYSRRTTPRVSKKKVNIILTLLCIWSGGLFSHSIVTENRLNLPNRFHLAAVQFLAKFHAVALLQSLRYFLCKE